MGFTYFECRDCGFDSVQRDDFKGSYICPICAGDNGRDVDMHRRPVRDDDGPVEGFDARRPDDIRAKQEPEIMTEYELLKWLGEAEHSQYGECYGATLVNSV